MEKEAITIVIKLCWSDWVLWDYVKCAEIPNKSGVYEAKYKNAEERLTIGATSNLKRRVKEGLVKGSIPHSTGEKIRCNENTSEILVRWATTDRPFTAEEELHKRYYDRFRKLPKYVKHT